MHDCCKAADIICKLQSNACSDETDRKFAECLHVNSIQSQSTPGKECRYVAGQKVFSSDILAACLLMSSNLF